MKNTFGQKKGFTLIEAIVTLVLVTFLLPVVANIVINSELLSVYAKHKMQAAYAAQQILEKERRLAFSTISSAPAAPVILDTRGTYNTTADDFTGTAIITVTNIDINRKKVQVEIDWQDPDFKTGQITRKEFFATTIADESALN